MNLLILGGTVFLGPYLVEYALSKNFNVTLLNRGNNPVSFSKDVNQIKADRTKELILPEDQFFDAIIDTSGQDPEVVKKNLETLKLRTSHYTYISSISVYRDFSKKEMDESDEVFSLESADIQDPVQKFGLEKVLCETEVASAFPERSLIIRPGLIVGPLDPTDRFTYWVRRVSEGGQIALPGSPEKPIQFIDARDLASWVIQQVSVKKTGIFNVTGPTKKLTFGQLIDTISSSTKAKIEPVWIPDEVLLKNKLQWWIDLPLWIPESQSNFKNFMNISNRKAIAAGLTFRPLEATIQDTLTWDQTRPEHQPLKAGISSEREKELFKLPPHSADGEGGGRRKAE